jgi:hypothetical protein
VKPDLCTLFHLFSVAAVHREHDGDKVLGKFDSQSIPMIAVGHCPNSMGIQFYNPSNGTLVSSIDYKFQHNVTSGAHFGLKYQPGVFIYRLDESTFVFAPHFSLDTSMYVHSHSPPATAKIIGIPTYDHPNIYTIAFRDGSISEYTDDLLSPVLDTTQLTPTSLLPKWITGGINVTLFLHNMLKLKHGTLQLSSEGQWYFYPGKQLDKNGIHLSNFEATCQDLLDTGQLFKGHSKFKNVYAT